MFPEFRFWGRIPVDAVWAKLSVRLTGRKSDASSRQTPTKKHRGGQKLSAKTGETRFPARVRPLWEYLAGGERSKKPASYALAT